MNGYKMQLQASDAASGASQAAEAATEWATPIISKMPGWYAQ